VSVDLKYRGRRGGRVSVKAKNSKINKQGGDARRGGDHRAFLGGSYRRARWKLKQKKKVSALKGGQTYKSETILESPGWEQTVRGRIVRQKTPGA